MAQIYTREKLFQTLATKQGKFVGDHQHESGMKTKLSYPSVKTPILTIIVTKTIQVSS